MVKLIANKSTGKVSTLLRENLIATPAIPEGAFIMPDPIITISMDLADSSDLVVLELEDNSPLFNGKDIAHIIESNDGAKYVFDEVKGLRVKPYFEVTRVDDVPLPEVANINVPFSLKIQYNDPDNVGYFDKFQLVKFKDRQGIISTSDFSLLDFTADKSKVVTLTGQYPGVALFRAKDEKYLCGIGTIAIKISI